LKEFDTIIIDGRKYQVPGNCGFVSDTIIIDCDELIGLFVNWKRDGRSLHGIQCFRLGHQLISSSRKYLIEHINGIEAEFYPE
jgi:hypothetical protein